MAKHKPEKTDGENNNENPILPGGLIPVEQWTLAETSVRRTLKGGLRHWLEQLGAGISSQEESFQSMDSLPELNNQQLQRLAPDPDRMAHAQALADAVAELRKQGHCQNPVLLIVAPPYSGVSRGLRCFPDCRIGSNTQGENGDSQSAYRRILPPDNLLMDADTARQWWEMQPLHEPWVISELAAFWRRHSNGLALVQELLRRVAQNCAGEGVIGCNSWCWQFWSSYYPDAQLAPWIPAPMTTDRLGIWLEQLAFNNDTAPVVRMATDGKYVLPLKPKKDDEKSYEKKKNSDLLRNLAADSRGIPGVALAIWRSALRARPESDADDDSDKQSEKKPKNPKAKQQDADCWIVPLDQLSLPGMPVSTERNLGLVLHALLMHDGLTVADLHLVTAVPEPGLSLAISRLARADMIAFGEIGQDTAFDLQSPEQRSTAYTDFAQNALWYVTPLGYPGTRRHLLNWGFPVDNF